MEKQLDDDFDRLPDKQKPLVGRIAELVAALDFNVENELEEPSKREERFRRYVRNLRGIGARDIQAIGEEEYINRVAVLVPEIG